MSHYETRSYQAWHWNMLLVMVALLFVTILRDFFKKIRDSHYADDEIHHCFTDSDSIKHGTGSVDCSLAFAA
jgi:cytochrome b561